MASYYTVSEEIRLERISKDVPGGTVTGGLEPWPELFHCGLGQNNKL